MKRHFVIFSTVIALIVGILSGFVVRGLLPFGRSGKSTLDSPLIASASAVDTLNTSANNISQTDNVSLVECAMEVAAAFRNGDYSTLTAYVHPEEGVTFTPNSTVDFNSNLNFSLDQLAAAAQDTTLYVWGIGSDGSTPIKLTISDYVSQYVCDAAYTSAPYLGVDQVLFSGNALENVAESYPDCRFVDFYCPGSTDNSRDWSALKLVFSWYQNEWYLVGVIHSAWSA